jgi:hypothetical protein
MYDRHLGAFHTVLIVDLVHVFLTFCIVVANLIIIANARRSCQSPSRIHAPCLPTSLIQLKENVRLQLFLKRWNTLQE